MPRLSSRLLVTVQFVGLGGVVLLGPWPEADSPAALILAGSSALGAWAILAVGRRSFRVLPEPKNGAELIERGPYRWVRHPMYTSLLLAAAGLVLGGPTAPRAVAFLTLAAALAAKICREERLLLARYPGYADYQGRTHRILPWLL